MTYKLVVVGASYGGFDALRVVLGTLPATFPLPVVVVQHQGPGSTELASLLQRYTSLVVAEAEDKDVPCAGWVHLAPPGYHLLIDIDGLSLSVDAPVVYARPSIDVLFESAADVYGAATIGVILTGTGRDGAAGLAQIKHRGGVTIVQDPETALRRMMPEAALAASRVDWMPPLEQIGGRLVALSTDAALPPVAEAPSPVPSPATRERGTQSAGSLSPPQRGRGRGQGHVGQGEGTSQSPMRT
jgi:two-component system chemotaxis response regulator CheB